MTRKFIPIISVIVMSVIAGWFFFDTNSLDKDILSQTFIVDAVYYEDEQIIKITFEDRSQKSSMVILEILGMSESFQKKFTKSSFVEEVPFSGPPKYGWKTNPVTFVVEHPEFGKIGLKTEIHPLDEPSRPIIYSSL